MRIAIGSDHAGFAYKQAIIGMLSELGHEVRDFGTDSDKPVDYPDFVGPAALAVGKGECERGIVLGGSGNGEAIVANKVQGVRCALCWDLETARLSRHHNDANVISIGQRMVSLKLALEIVRVWLTEAFEGGRHVSRVNGIASWEDAKRLPSNNGDLNTLGYPMHEKTLLIRPEYLNQHGTLFGGYMMKWADDLAFSAASLTFPKANFVTRRMEAFDFTSPVGNGDIVKIRSQVERLGNTSCVVKVSCVNARTENLVFRTSAVMVHLDPQGRKASVPT